MTGWRKLGLIAGGGGLPARIVAERVALDEPFHLVRIKGATGEELAGYDGNECAIGEVGRILKILKAAECDAVCFAGIVHRPDFSALKVDWRGATLLPQIIAAAAKGDGAILDLLVKICEAENFIVVGADEAVRGLKASAGAFGQCQPKPEDIADIAKAAAIIRALGEFDVGQAAIVAKGHSLAIEAAEGTDLMLARCANLPGAPKSERGGVLVKCPKPGQELRVDLPVIGPKTVAGALAAGLNGIAVEAERALVMNKDEMVETADAAGLFIYGFTGDELDCG